MHHIVNQYPEDEAAPIQDSPHHPLYKGHTLVFGDFQSVGEEVIANSPQPIARLTQNTRINPAGGQDMLNVKASANGQNFQK